MAATEKEFLEFSRLAESLGPVPHYLKVHYADYGAPSGDNRGDPSLAMDYARQCKQYVPLALNQYAQFEEMLGRLYGDPRDVVSVAGEHGGSAHHVAILLPHAIYFHISLVVDLEASRDSGDWSQFDEKKIVQKWRLALFVIDQFQDYDWPELQQTIVNERVAVSRHLAVDDGDDEDLSAYRPAVELWKGQFETYKLFSGWLKREGKAIRTRRKGQKLLLHAGDWTACRAGKDRKAFESMAAPQDAVDALAGVEQRTKQIKARKAAEGK